MINPSQPPEGILDPQQPWWPTKNIGEVTWRRLKAKLTGRKDEYGTQYSSFVNLAEADADRLIENIKKYGQYPQVNQNGKDGGYSNLETYQKWLVEEFLEKPFREEVDRKIDEREVERRVQEIVDRVNQKKSQNIVVTEKLFPAIIDPWEGSETPSSQIIVIHPKEDERKLPLLLPPATSVVEEVPVAEIPDNSEDEEVDDVELDEIEEKEKTGDKLSPVPLPRELPDNLKKNFVSIGKDLDKISRQLSAQNILIRRNIFKQKKVSYSYSVIEQLISDQVENYVEAIADLETKDIETKYESQNLSASTPAAEPPDLEPEPSPPSVQVPPPDKQSEGVISYRPVRDNVKVLTPGVYDNPTVGQLLPGFAVIPYNRNYGKKILNQYDLIEYKNALGQAMLQPMRSALAGAAVRLGDTVNALGAFAPFFVGSLDRLVDPLSSILGISRASASELLGGQEYLSDKPVEKRFPDFINIWKSVMKSNNWVFLGGGTGTDKGDDDLEGEVFKDILSIGEKGEGFRAVYGQNTGNLPSWIPFPKSEYGKLDFASGFGMRLHPIYGGYRHHNGLDIAGEPGAKIISPFAGKVSAVDDDTNGSGYGKYVEIEHTQPKIFTFYGHMRKIANGMTVGSSVQAGQLIGELGNTGDSTGPHLHWEVRKKSGYGSQIDPVPFTKKFKPGPDQTVRRKLTDYPEYELDAYTQYDEGKIVRLGNKLFKINNLGALGDEVPSFQSGGSVGSFQWGGILSGVPKILTKIVTPLERLINSVAPVSKAKPPTTRGLSHAPLKRIMHGTANNVPNLIRANGFREQAGMLGTGVYGSVKGWVADTYRGAGAWKGIVPGQGPRLDMLVPQGARTLRGATVVSARQADRALSIADGILSGKYTGAKAQQLLPLLTQSTPTMAQAFAPAVLKVASKGLAVLNAPVIGDMIMPEGTSAYDQLSGPNAYYNAPGYKGPTFTTVDMPTRKVVATTQSRRL